jgi:hypothetical protein
MKKGFSFALLMVVLVALAVPASAMAPVIGDLPSVIIGDAGDVTGSGTQAVILLRYTNVFNLASPSVVLQRDEPVDPSRLKVFYSTESTTLKASNATSLVQPITDAELAALQADGTVPAAKVINTETDLWLSLIHDLGSNPASAAAATVAADGVVVTDPAMVSVLAAPAVVSLFATDTDPAKVSQPGEFVVYSLRDAEDAYSPDFETIINYSFEGSTDGWTYKSPPTTGFGPVAQQASSTAIGFNATARTDGLAGYSSWESDAGDDSQIPVTGMAGKVFRARLSLSGNAASSAAAPGYRFLYLTLGLTHAGGFQVLTPANAGEGVTATNSPWTGNDVEARAYWAAPFDTNAYSDSDPVNGSLMTGITLDFRSYYCMFDAVQTDATDAGTLMLDNLAIEAILRPANVTPAVRWGSATGAIAFNAATDTAGGWAAMNAGAFGFGAGTATINAGNITASMGAGTSGYIQLAPTSQAASVFPAWESNTLYRLTTVVSSSAVNTAPAFRMFILPVRPNEGNPIGVMWADTMNLSFMNFRHTPSVSSKVGAPKTSGSTLEGYIYGMTAASGAEASILTPSFDIAQANDWDMNSWTRPNANLTFSSVSIEKLD